MKVSTLSALIFLATGANAFVSQSLSSERSSRVVSYGYIPDGFTAEDWKKFKEEEAAKNKKNLGKLGPRGFQSRSFQSFQEVRTCDSYRTKAMVSFLLIHSLLLSSFLPSFLPLKLGTRTGRGRTLNACFQCPRENQVWKDPSGRVSV